MGMSGVVGGHGSGAPAIGGASGLVPGVSRASPIAEGVAQIERRSSENIQAAARTIDSFVRDMGRSLDFRVDSSSGKQIVRVSNPQTGEVVRQIPNEEAVQIARSLNYLQSVLVSIKA
jgi:flagellar protein FlaG